MKPQKKYKCIFCAYESNNPHEFYYYGGCIKCMGGGIVNENGPN
jgi:hypothetical protein